MAAKLHVYFVSAMCTADISLVCMACGAWLFFIITFFRSRLMYQERLFHGFPPNGVWSCLYGKNVLLLQSEYNGGSNSQGTHVEIIKKDIWNCQNKKSLDGKVCKHCVIWE